MLIKKIIATTLSLSVVGTFELFAASQLSAEQMEILFDSANACYEKNKENLTPKILGQMEFRLKLIIENQNTSNDTLAKTAYLLFRTDCKTSYLKTMNILFHKSNFNAPLYSALIKSIAKLKIVKEKEEEQRRLQRFEKQQTPAHVDPQAEIAASPPIGAKNRVRKNPKSHVGS